MPPSLTCYQCSATLLGGTEICPGCGARQTPEAKAHFTVSSGLRAQLARTRQALVVCSVVAFALGMYARARETEITSAQILAAAAARQEPLEIEELNDAFMRAMNRRFSAQRAPLNFTGWVPAPDGGVILEMAPPTRDRPLTVWETFTSQDRTELVGFLGIAYTKALVAGGRAPDLSARHPVVVLQYRGVARKLAERRLDGRIAVYPSPYEGLVSRAMEVVTPSSASAGAGQP